MNTLIILGLLPIQKLLFGIALASLSLLFLIFVICEPMSRRMKRRLRQKYTLIYRVVSVSSDEKIILKTEGTTIEAGDYGWEAEPVYEDGLIYLHGLNPRWQVVWYAGFRLEKLEVVGKKPCSQYYIYPDWVDFTKIPVCPFPVQKFEYGKAYPVFHFGFAEEISRDSVQGRRVKRS